MNIVLAEKLVDILIILVIVLIRIWLKLFLTCALLVQSAHS